MREPPASVDANLLVALSALLEERNLTRAGERLAMSPAAVSRALRRLRTHYGDALLVRSGRGLALTDLGRELLEPAREAVSCADALLEHPRTYDPAVRPVTFTAAMSDYAMSVLGGPLVALFAERAPECSISIDIVRATSEQMDGDLLRHDITVGPLDFDLPGRKQPIFADELVCVLSSDNPLLEDGALSADSLRLISQASVEYSWRVPGLHPLEDALARAGVPERRVVLQVSSLLSLPYAIAGTSMCAFVPSLLAKRCAGTLGLSIARTPVAPVAVVEAAHWHPRRAADPALAWLLGLLHDVAVQVADELDGDRVAP
jgi:DNA-binding transcriptional LysR family regulator